MSEWLGFLKQFTALESAWHKGRDDFAWQSADGGRTVRGVSTPCNHDNDIRPSAPHPDSNHCQRPE
jgi:hypothetical protein